MITCVSGVTIRMAVKNISELSRATQGVKLIRVDEGDEIAAITQLDENEEEVDILLDETAVEGSSENILEGEADTEAPGTDAAANDAADETSPEEEA
jgi:DNA gyrase subunit A